MTTILKAIRERDLTQIRLILGKNPEVVNEQHGHSGTALMLAISRNYHEAIDVLLDTPCLDWDARNDFNQTILFKTVQIGNTDLVKRLLTEPKFAPTLQKHSDLDQYSLWQTAFTHNHAEIVPLLCAQFPNAIFHRNQDDLTPLHYLGEMKANQQTQKILKYLLKLPGIERSLETQDLSAILFTSFFQDLTAPLLFQLF